MPIPIKPMAASFRAVMVSSKTQRPIIFSVCT